MSSKVISVRLTEEDQLLVERLIQVISERANSGLNMSIKVSQGDVVRIAIKELAERLL